MIKNLYAKEEKQINMNQPLLHVASTLNKYNYIKINLNYLLLIIYKELIMSKAPFSIDFIKNTNPTACNIEEFHLVDTFLSTFFDKQDLHPCFAVAVNRILLSHGIIRMEELMSKPVCVSQRQIERLFKLHVGLSPKKFSEIIQFKFSLDLLQNDNLALIEVALMAGYFDQAHFIHSFKKFTSISPEKFLKYAA